MHENATLRRSLPGGVWSIVAPHRSRRPQPLADERTEVHSGCDFCPGHEGSTEPEVAAVRVPGSEPNAPGWQVRVVPNKYPALELRTPTPAGVTPYRQTAARGCHEVIIETPHHDRGLAAFGVEELELVLSVYRQRLQALKARRGVRAVAVFRNEGAAAGASQKHAHSQVLALPLVPRRLAQEVLASCRHLQRRGSCVTCEMIQHECDRGTRLVKENRHFAALASFAPRFPYETWILPKSHAHDFAECEGPELHSLAAVVKDVLASLEATLGRFPFNFVLQTAPVRVSSLAERAFHWRLEIIPRLTTASGFEVGTGLFIVSVTPEDAAAALRSALDAGSPSPRSTGR